MHAVASGRAGAHQRADGEAARKAGKHGESMKRLAEASKRPGI